MSPMLGICLGQSSAGRCLRRQIRTRAGAPADCWGVRRAPTAACRAPCSRPAATLLDLFVAGSAVVAGVLQAMAVHAAAHGDIALAEKFIPLFHRSMAIAAGGFRFLVNAMAEVDVARN